MHLNIADKESPYHINGHCPYPGARLICIVQPADEPMETLTEGFQLGLTCDLNAELRTVYVSYWTHDGNVQQVMRANDQLLKEMQRGNVFKQYKEGMLDFPPTYKYDKNSETWVSPRAARFS